MTVYSREFTVTYEHLTGIAAGLKTAWPATQTSIVLDQQTLTIAQLEAQLAAALTPFQAVVDARSTLATAMKNRADALADAEKLVSGFYAVLPQYLGSNNADIAKFGKSAPKARTPLTVEQKAAAAAKAKATRAARHTLGKNQKKAITGASVAATSTPPATSTSTTGVTPAVVAPKIG